MAEILVLAGYGGHAGYAYAVLYHLVNNYGVDPSRIDVLIPQNYKWVREKLRGLGNIREAPLPRRPNEPLLRTLHRWPRALLRGLRECKDYRVVLASGSNFSLPHAAACLLRRKTRVYAIEAVDRILTASRTPKLLSKLGAVPILSWEEQKKNYPTGLVVGPLYEPRIYEPGDDGYILVTTGTLGLPRLYKALARLGLDNVVVQSGDIPVGEVRKLNPRWRVFQYTPDLARLIARASIVVTHFPGMTGVTARLAYRKPVVLVQSWRHKLSADPREGPILAEKLRAPYVEIIEPDILARALEEALSTKPPSYPDGAYRTAGIIVGEYKRF